MSYRRHDTPAQNVTVITPSDSTDLVGDHVIAVVIAGNLSVTTPGGQTITVTAAPVGWRSPFLVRRVRSTGTTATVVGLS